MHVYIAFAVILLSGCVTSHPSEESEPSDRTFTITGAVVHPNRYEIPEGQAVTLSKALEMAGGAIEGDYFSGERSAQLRRTIIVRHYRTGREERITLDARTSYGINFKIMPGDYIMINELV